MQKLAASSDIYAPGFAASPWRRSRGGATKTPRNTGEVCGAFASAVTPEVLNSAAAHGGQATCADLSFHFGTLALGGAPAKGERAGVRRLPA